MTEQSEKELRVQLAACYRIFDYLGWTELIYNHITVKLPGENEQFLINPYGLSYNEVKASNLVKVDIHGNILEETPYRVNPAGMLIHSAIHEARSDVHCITHTHTTAGLTVACQQCGLRADNFYSVLLHDRIAYHDFEGITVQPDEKARLVSDLGDKSLMILRNHGLLSCGDTIPQAFFGMWAMQRACEIQVSVDQTGKPAIDIPLEIANASAELYNIQKGSSELGEMEFNALVRKIEAIDPSYKD